MKPKKTVLIREGSGNVFEDLGLDGSEELQTKSGLVIRLAALIEARGLTQSEVALILGIDQPKVSNLLRGRLEGFSTDRLMRFLATMDQDIEIVVRNKPRNAMRHGQVSVITR